MSRLMSWIDERACRIGRRESRFPLQDCSHETKRHFDRSVCQQMDREVQLQLGPLAVSLAGALDAFDRESRLAIGCGRLIQFLPGREEVFVGHARHRLRPALGIEQDVGIWTDVLDWSFRMDSFCSARGRGRCLRRGVFRLRPRQRTAASNQ